MFYELNQNNSGGYYIDNENVAQVIIVEADNQYDAKDILESIVEDYSEYCECCGYRWDLDFGVFGIKDGKEEPCIYDMPIKEYMDDNNNPWYTHAIVYYLNGDKVDYKAKS